MENHNPHQLVLEHEAAGKYFDVGSIRSFRLDSGQGTPVVCIHGVPTSSYLYRKVIGGLSEKGHRGICIDLPGLGLSDRPEDFDYEFLNFADFLAEALKVLGIGEYHLVVHDIGGPIGFALAAGHREKILSLSILNTWIDVVNYEKPYVMKPFEKKGIGEAELKMITHFSWPLIFRQLGILDPHAVSVEEMNVYVDLLKRKDGGKAFLKIMRNFNSTPEFRDLCFSSVENPPYPLQALWGEKDLALTYSRYGTEIKKVAGLKEVSLLPARHFLQEEAWMSICDKINEIILSSKRPDNR